MILTISIDLMRPMELVTQINLTELFEPEDNGKDTINWNETKQIGWITGESCCNCNYRQSWIFLPFVYIFPVCAAWLGEMTTLRSITCSWTIDGINGIKWADGVYNVYGKDWIEMKQSWWTCWNWWNGKNQINGIDKIDKTVGISRANEIDGIKRVVVI